MASSFARAACSLSGGQMAVRAVDHLDGSSHVSLPRTGACVRLLPGALRRRRRAGLTVPLSYRVRADESVLEEIPDRSGEIGTEVCASDHRPRSDPEVI
jgi:hypothetical protein